MIALAAAPCSPSAPATTATASRALEPPARRPRRSRRLSAAVVLVTGVIVTAAGPHSGDDDVTKRFGDLLLALQVHVRAAVVFTVLAACSSPGWPARAASTGSPAASPCWPSR